MQDTQEQWNTGKEGGVLPLQEKPGSPGQPLSFPDVSVADGESVLAEDRGSQPTLGDRVVTFSESVQSGHGAV